MKSFSRFFIAIVLCSATCVSFADNPLVVDNWQIGVVSGDEGSLGVSTTTVDPNLTEPFVSITQDGKVGIGTQYPTQALHIVDGNVLISHTSRQNRAPGSQNGSILFGSDVSDEAPYGRWGIEFVDSDADGHGLNFWKPWNPVIGGSLNHVLFLQNNGNVGIATQSPQYKLDVNGTLRAREILVNLDGTGGADFVFDTDYRLRPLSEVQSYIQENKHLPEIQSAAEMQANGISVNELQFQLLQKIEELTLYIIEQEKQIQGLQQKINEL